MLLTRQGCGQQQISRNPTARHVHHHPRIASTASNGSSSSSSSSNSSSSSCKRSSSRSSSNGPLISVFSDTRQELADPSETPPAAPPSSTEAASTSGMSHDPHSQQNQVEKQDGPPSHTDPGLVSVLSPLMTPLGTPRRGRLSGPAICVFSGGTAFNVIAGRLRQLTDRVAYILPVSDDGGSTAEIVRVLGGPAVGDIRSRCLRLADDCDEEARAVKALLAHRLHASDSTAAKFEWYTIVEGEHRLWQGVSEPYKHVIRAFLVHFHTTILRHSTESFNFCNGSIGNFFFAGSRNFFRSLEAAIFLFSRVARLPEGSLVLPAICTEERITLGAELEDGTVLRGQNQISHPPGGASGSTGRHEVNKSQSYDLLPSPIRRVFYLSSEGSGQEHEVTPKVNPRALQEIERADAIIYGMGSLYTSICPIICLDGMGEAIAMRDVPKILCLNASLDRETASSGAHDGAMTASDIVQAICDALNRRRNRKGQRLRHTPSMYVDGLLIPRGGSIRVDHQALALLGVRHVMEVPSVPDADSGANLFEPSSLVQAIDKMISVLNGTSGEAQESLTSLGVTI